MRKIPEPEIKNLNDIIQTPRIIIQTWKTKNFPDKLKAYQESWLKHNPTYDYMLLTDEDNDRLVKVMETEFPGIYDMYRHLETIPKTDVARFSALYFIGGLYADADCKCLKPFDYFMDQNNFVCGTEPYIHKYAGGKQLLGTSLLISPKRHPFVKHYLELLPSRKDIEDIIEATGPPALTEAYRTYKGPEIIVTEPDVFYPEASAVEDLDEKYRRRLATGECPNTSYAVHYWGHASGKVAF